MKTLLSTLLIIFTTFTSMAPAANWNAIPAKTKITFVVDGPFGKVNGSIGGLKATLFFDEKNLTASSIIASVEVRTIETGIALRNRDLLSQEEWFQPEKYPNISFRSTLFQKTATGYKVTGDLTLKASTKPVDIDFTFLRAKAGGMFKGALTINREDYGLGQSKTVGKDISIAIEVPVKR